MSEELTQIQKIEQEKEINLRRECFEKAVQINGYSLLLLSNVLKDAKIIETYIKTGK